MSPFLSLRSIQREPDARLVALVRAGQERAFEVLVKRYRKPLLAYAQRILGRDAHAEDAVQQALLHAWIALQANAEVDEVGPWLFRIVRNTAVSSLRRRSYECVELNQAIDAVSPRDEAELRVMWGETVASLAALPELQRKAIVLTALDGKSQGQAAAALGVTDGAVRGLVYRARAALRAAAAALLPLPSTELAGGGSVGAGGVLVKGGAVVAIAGTIATASQVVVRATLHGHRRAHVAAAVRSSPKPMQVAAMSATVVQASAPEHAAVTSSDQQSAAPTHPARATGSLGGRSSDDRGSSAGSRDRLSTDGHDRTGVVGSHDVGETSRGTDGVGGTSSDVAATMPHSGGTTSSDGGGTTSIGSSGTTSIGGGTTSIPTTTTGGSDAGRSVNSPTRGD